MKNTLLNLPLKFAKSVIIGFFLISGGATHAQWEFVGSPETLDFIDFAYDGEVTYVAAKGGIYYTNDQGDTWHPIPNNSLFIQVKSIEVIEGKLYVSSRSFSRHDQLYVSDDGGVTWEEIKMAQNYGHGISDYAIRGDTMIMAMYKWLFISYDGGKTIADDV